MYILPTHLTTVMYYCPSFISLKNTKCSQTLSHLSPHYPCEEGLSRKQLFSANRWEHESSESLKDSSNRLWAKQGSRIKLIPRPGIWSCSHKLVVAWDADREQGSRRTQGLQTHHSLPLYDGNAGEPSQTLTVSSLVGEKVTTLSLLVTPVTAKSTCKI